MLSLTTHAVGACNIFGDHSIIMTEGCMNWSKGITIIAASSLCLGLGACNMYVIDFENKLPDGSVLAPKADTPPPPPPEPLAPPAADDTVSSAARNFSFLVSIMRFVRRPEP